MQKVSAKSKSQKKFFVIGNNLAIDFANTATGVDGKETLKSWQDVADFLHAKKLSVGNLNSPKDKSAFVFALKLRTLIRNIIESIVSKKPLKAKDFSALNQYLSKASGFNQFEKQPAGRWHLGWKYDFNLDDDPAVLFYPIIKSLPEFLESDNLDLVRKCANCPLFFYDRSKTHLRQWCSMAVCGNRIKVAAFARRQSKF